MRIIESICFAITFQCDLECKYCYVNCGPNNKQAMDSKRLIKALYNTAPHCKKIWISGGEPTTRMDLLELALKICTEIKKEHGYPHEIVLQTNGYWGREEQQAKEMLLHFANLGVTDIHVPADDIFHYEQMKSNDIPKKFVELAKSMNLFNSVELAGSSPGHLKALGRYKMNFKLASSFIDDCACYNDHYIVYPNFDVFCCKWAVNKSLGKAYDDSIIDLIESPHNQFSKILFDGGPLLLCDAYNKLTDEGLKYNYDVDICEFCKLLTNKYCNLVNK